MKNKITKQYIAGFFDGEGSIGIYKRKDRYNGACLRTQLAQTKTRLSTILFEELKKRYGGNISTDISLSGRVTYNWQLNPKGVPKFLKDISPYLILKKSQAQLGLYWIKNRPKVKRDWHGRVINFTGNEIEFTNKIIRAMKELKREDIDVVMKNQEDLVEILVELTPPAVIKG